MKNLSLFLFTIVTLFCSSAEAQEMMSYQNPKEYELPPNIIPTVRKYWVSLPKDYDYTTNRYPILFLFDGNETYMRNALLQATDQLTKNVRIPPCIIVGLVQRNRTRDFGPLYAIKGTPNSDKVNAEKFLKFLKTELTPELDKRYRTQNFRVGIGHSLGGLFLTHSFTQEPDFFNGIVAISPALELNRDSTLFANLKQTLASNLTRPLSYCWASGDDGMSEVAFKPGSVALGKLLATAPNKSFSFKYIDLPGKDHNITPLFTMPEALVYMFRDWDIALWYRPLFNNKVDPESYLADRRKLMKKLYDFEVDPTEDRILDNIGRQLHEQKNYKKALPYVQQAIRINPDNSGYYQDLSNIYEKLNNYDAALVNIKTAIERLDKTTEQYTFIMEEFQKNLKRIEAAISK